MRSAFLTTFAQCEFGDWLGIGVLIAIGLFSLTFLGLGSALLAKCLFENGRRKSAGTT
jgi:hypothetical protein